MHRLVPISFVALELVVIYFAPLMTLAESTTSARQEVSHVTQSRRTDFDFLLGKWEVRNRRLKARLVGSDEWVEFSARLEKGRKLLNGLALMDQFKAEFDGKYFEGASLRLFNPVTEQWTIYWMDTNHPEITEQVVGGFKDGIGEFYGEELFQGKPVKLRFIWSEITARSARWEQAYFDEARSRWEINWIMEFTRIEE